MASYIYSKLTSFFQDSRSERGNSLSRSSKSLANGILSNGRAGHTPSHSKKGGVSSDIPTVQITDSPSAIHRLHKAASVGSVSGYSEDSSIRSPDERPSSAGSRSTKGEGSVSPTHDSRETVMSPSRKTMEALKKVINTSMTTVTVLSNLAY